MKKIKLFALAAFAMLSINAFAIATPYEDANTIFRFSVTTEGTETTPGEATILGFVSGYEAYATTKIEATVVGAKTGFTYKVNAIDENAFKDVAITTLDLSGATNLETIGAGAFAGTSITSLDLSATKVATIENLFGTEYAAAPNNKPNNKLTEVKLPASWTLIKTSAFENCIALATIDFGTIAAADYAAHAEQVIQTKAFYGCQLTALDFTGTKVTAIPAKLLMDKDATFVTTNSTLETVTLIAGITTLNASFADCTALSSINIEACRVSADANAAGSLTLVENEFLNDAALTSIDLSYVLGAAIPAHAFENTGLTSVTFPKTDAAKGITAIANIGTSAFAYAPITTVTFAEGYAGALTIAAYAFATTKIAAITLPATTTGVAANAFNLVTTLKEVTFKPEAASDIFDDDAFNLCNDDTEANWIKIYTTYANKDSNEPNYAVFVVDAKPTTVYVYNEEAKKMAKSWTVTKFTNADKYFVKVYAAAGIRVKKSDAKVYAAYLDGDVMNMQLFKSVDQYYHIGAGYPALIITSKSDLAFEDEVVTEFTNAEAPTGDADNGSSWVDAGDNAIMMNWDGAAVVYNKFAELFTAAAGTTVYGWTAAGTWNPAATSMSSMTVPVGLLYIIGEKEAAAGRLIIRWLDEDGNVESETTSIQSIATEPENEDGVMYNLAGQKVNASYKGVVIKNGKKYMK